MTLMKHKLDALCLDALKEVGNIGAGNAMTALAELLNQTVDMSVPLVGITALDDFVAMAGGAEAVSVGVYMYVDGEAPGHVAFLMPQRDAFRLVDKMLMQDAGTTQELDEMAASALKEMGNIMASSYLVAIGNMTGLNLLSSPPEILFDMTGAIVSAITAELVCDEESVLTIITEICHETGATRGSFTYIPEDGSLTKILAALGLDGQ